MRKHNFEKLKEFNENASSIAIRDFDVSSAKKRNIAELKYLPEGADFEDTQKRNYKS